MRGEDLQGLNIEELQQLEKMLESGLGRVLETKVCIYFYFYCKLSIYIYHDSCRCSHEFYFPYQSERIMNEISSLERKVRRQIFNSIS